MATVEFRKVSKSFAAGKAVIRDFSLSLADGERLVLVGPSGCGKSTCLRLLAGLETPDAGDILIDGRTVNALSPQQRNVAMVFQNYALYPHLSVRGNLEFPLRMARLAPAAIDAKVNATAELLDLTALLARKPAQLSGGQRQRVAMGRALVREPAVLLLDEPLSNLDARLRAQIRGEIAALQQRLRITTVYVTHDQVEAMTIGERVAVLDRGALQQLDTPQALYQQPRNRFVAQFLGSPGMNVLPVRIRAAGDALQAVLPGGQALALPERLRSAWLARQGGESGELGIRPEALSLEKGTQRGRLRMRVTANEFVGHETLLTLGLEGADGTSLIARLPGRVAPNDGAGIDVLLDAEAMYLFDAAGRRIDA